MIDKNKTPLTHRVTATAVAFFDALYCRPIETEVSVADGWIADVATFMEPTLTGSKKLRLHDRFIDKDYPNNRDIYRAYDEMCQHYNFPLTVIVEVKTTRADFLKDAKTKFKRRPAHLCYLAYPTGIIEDKEIPQSWGAIRMSKNGQRIYRRPQHASVEPQHPGDTIRILAEIAKRRDSRTRRAATRDWLKSYRAEEAGYKRYAAASKIMSLITNWLTSRNVNWGQDMTLKDILENCGVKTSESMETRIKKLEELREMLLMIDGE